MPSLTEVSDNIEKLRVEDENGWGQTITFTYHKTNQVVSGIRAFCMVRRQDGLNEKAQVYEDGMAFLSVFLDIKPSRGDKIEFDGETWIVENLEGVKPYDIFCRSGARHSGARSGRRER